jgi:HEAT repeat protein
LTEVLSSKDADTRREAAVAIALIGHSAESAVPSLIKLMDDKSFAYRGAAAYALGKIGSKSATEALTKALDADDSMLRLTSVWALLQLDPDNAEYAKIAVPRLAGALSVDRPRVRREAAITLGKLGSKSSSAVKDLQKALNDEVPDVRLEAIIALAEIGAASQPAVPDLIAMVNGLDPVVRRPATYALGRIGAGAKEAVPALRRLLQSRNHHEQTVAAWALVQIAPDAATIQTALPLIIKALQESHRVDIRAEAARTLGQIGAGSAPAQEALKAAAAKDSSEDVRKAAEAALKAKK